MSPSTPTKPRRESRDTGFPEPLDGIRNTTLPHPDADLSPNATISQDDLLVERSMKRTRRSFLNRRKPTVNHGFINPQLEAIQSVLSLTLVDTSGIIAEPAIKPSTPTTMSSARFSKDGYDSAGSIKEKHEDTPPSSPELSERPRRRSLLGKLRRW